MKKNTVILIVSGTILFGALLFVVAMLAVKYLGTEVTAVIVKLPTKCSRYSDITVEYEHQHYSIGISAESCRKGVYEIGQEVQLIYHKGFNTMMSTGIAPEFITLLVIAIAVFLYFQYRWEQRKYP